MIRILCILFSLFATTAFADNEMVVKLATDTHLIPLSLANIQEKGSGFSTTYVDNLQGVLHFDLNYNGLTQVTGNEGLAKYSVKAEIVDKQLTLYLTTKGKNESKKVGPIALNGSLNQDRGKIHELADLIYKSISGHDGIATSKILYTVKEPNLDPVYKAKWVSEVWESDYDGANARKVTHEKRYIVTPTYLPPKKGYRPGTFLFVSYVIGQPKIYVASLKDGTGTRLTSLRGNQLMPAVSKQRDQVAFISDIGGNPDLFIMAFDPNGSSADKPRQLFATAKGTQGSPAFSPDGKKIAFVSNKDGSPRIYTMPIMPEGTLAKDMNPKLISKRSKESTSPSWSPDGSKIAYSAMTSGTRQIWIYDIDAQEEAQLTTGKANKENPSWAPDSIHLIFDQGDDDKSEIYMVNLNQPEAIRISKGAGAKRFPAWEPK